MPQTGVRVEIDMSGEAGFRHEALVYDGPEDFLVGAVPFLRAALELDEPALVAVSGANRALLEGELGADAASIRFADMESVGRNPARVIPFWRVFVDAHAGQSLRGIGEPVWPGRRPAEIEECLRHESLLNVAFSPPPGWALLCPYDGAALDDEVLAEIARSHHAVHRDGVGEESAEFVATSDCFAGDLPARPGSAEALGFDGAGLAAVRRRVEAAAARAGLAAQRAADLVAAASELAANSVAHGGGNGMLRLWRDGSRLVVEVEDRGLIEEPLAGRLRPLPSQLGGRGLWLANQLCDLVQIRSGRAGTTIRLHAAIA